MKGDKFIMAREQIIKTFKEGNKMYIVIENPTKDVEKQINALFGNVAGDLATILKPESIEDTTETASKIDSKVEDSNDKFEVIAADEAVVKELKLEETDNEIPDDWTIAENSDVTNEENPNNVAPVEDSIDAEKSKEKEPKKKDPTEELLEKIKDKTEAQALVRRCLAREDASGDTYSKRMMLLVLNLPNETKKMQIMKMSESEAAKIWNENNLRQIAIKFSGYKPKSSEPKSDEIQWV